MSKRVLLLTPWYFPTRVLHWQDAVKMVYEETVDVVAEYDEEIRSPSVTWKVPAVVRLKRLAANAKRGVKFSRRNVYQRDGHRCQYCGERKPESELSYDHVVPRASGGRTNWLNIVTACRTCNTRKGSRTCDEAGMWPLRAPVVPAQEVCAPLVVEVEAGRGRSRVREPDRVEHRAEELLLALAELARHHRDRDPDVVPDEVGFRHAHPAAGRRPRPEAQLQLRRVARDGNLPVLKGRLAALAHHPLP